MVPHAYDDSVALLERLIDAGHDVTMLTNWAADTFAEARSRFAFLEKPRGVTVSGEIGLIKPDRAIYDHHAASFGTEPAATLFIDDSEKNVEGAQSAGWQAVLFTDARALERDLIARGISF
jgi:2-haloacid dehalogenase